MSEAKQKARSEASRQIISDLDFLRRSFASRFELRCAHQFLAKSKRTTNWSLYPQGFTLLFFSVNKPSLVPVHWEPDPQMQSHLPVPRPTKRHLLLDGTELPRSSWSATLHNQTMGIWHGLPSSVEVADKLEELQEVIGCQRSRSHYAILRENASRLSARLLLPRRN